MSRHKKYLIDISPKTVRTKIKAKNKLLWFDQDSKKMLEFEGGKLVPFFDMKLKKLVPKIEDVHYVSYKTESNEKEVRDWIDNYGSRLGAEIDKTESNKKEITVNVDEINASVFEYALDRKGFLYEKV